MKRPAFQFYPADWRKDPALSICSLAARGLWIELMCIMHEADEYGTLTVNGKAMTLQQIARMVGESPAILKKIMDELEDAGVFSRATDGSIYSRRMTRDEEIREARAAGGEAGKSFGHLGAEHGKKGGRPRKGTGVKKPPLEPPPSSSSSSSTSVNAGKPESRSNSPGADAPPSHGRTQVDPAFTPSDSNRHTALTHSLDIDSERDRFVAHYTATGDYRVNWHSQFQKWLLDSMQHKADASRRAQAPPRNGSKQDRQFIAARSIFGTGENHERTINGDAERIDDAGPSLAGGVG